MKIRIIIASCYLVVMSFIFVVCIGLYTTNDKKNKEIFAQQITNEKNDESNNEQSNHIDNEVNQNENNNINTSNDDYENLSSEKISWWYVPNSTHQVPEINENLDFKIEDYNAIYVGDTSRKVLYLTMDEGYENGHTGKILDILKNNNVKANFFICSSYIKENPELVLRMVNEGHLVGNHSKTHRDPTTLTDDKEEYYQEIYLVENRYKSLTGNTMSKYYRPPEGLYSEKTLSMNSSIGYKTVFWSFAYNDWEVDNQPDPKQAKTKILDGLHNGAIILLHPISSTNTEILDDIIKMVKNMGYTFDILPDIEVMGRNFN